MTPILWTKKWAEKTEKKNVILAKAGIQKKIKKSIPSRKIEKQNHIQIQFQFFNMIESSNAIAKTLKVVPKTPLLLLAQEQTQPYGRKKRKWIASDFMATWTWESTDILPPVFSPLLGLCLYNSFKYVWPSDLWSLKAPNDIYLAEKKIAGLLLETQIFKRVQVILGLGMNVFKSPPHKECISNHFVVDEILWHKFLDFFWQSLIDLKNKKGSKISAKESQALMEGLTNHSQYKDLTQVLEDGSLVFKNKKIHWTDL